MKCTSDHNQHAITHGYIVPVSCFELLLESCYRCCCCHAQRVCYCQYILTPAPEPRHSTFRAMHPIFNIVFVAFGVCMSSTLFEWKIPSRLSQHHFRSLSITATFSHDINHCLVLTRNWFLFWNCFFVSLSFRSAGQSKRYRYRAMPFVAALAEPCKT